MGERDAAWQEPGYNGICNYAQKITSCFGLDGKSRCREGWVRGGDGCACGAGWMQENQESLLVCKTLILGSSVNPSEHVLVPRKCVGGQLCQS